MATTVTVLYRGVAPTSSTTLYTAPASTTAVVTEIIISNTSSGLITATISLNGVVIIPNVTVAGNGVAIFNMNEVLPTTQILAGFASSTLVNFSISGVQIV